MAHGQQRLAQLRSVQRAELAELYAELVLRRPLWQSHLPQWRHMQLQHADMLVRKRLRRHVLPAGRLQTVLLLLVVLVVVQLLVQLLPLVQLIELLQFFQFIQLVQLV